MSDNDDKNANGNKKEEKVVEIAASSIRSGLAELEMQASQTLQRLENVRLNNNTANASAQNSPPAIPGTAEAINQFNSANSITAATLHSLQNDRRSPTEILNLLEQLISQSDADDDPEFPLPALDEVSHLALISHSIVAYLSHLDRKTLLRLTGQISSDTSRWLGNLFRFVEPTASFHVDNADATLRIVRLAIISRCPGYLEGGIPALAHPCLYISENTTPLRLQFACRQLGIPLDAVRLIPSNPTNGTMDLLALQKLIQNDINANRNPLLVIADVGASICGYVDDLIKMKEICNANNVWLHVTGHRLAALAVWQGPGMISSIVDSIVLNLGSWLGLPSLPIVLLHRQLQNISLSVFDSDPILSRRLNSLSLWTSLQALGKESISEKIHVAFQTCSILYEITSKCEGLRILNRPLRRQNDTFIGDIISKAHDINDIFDGAIPEVVFQFDGMTPILADQNSNKKLTGDQNQDLTQAIINKSIEKIANAPYFDRLNSWLGQIMQRDCPNFDFEIIEQQGNGTCIRYCPLELGLGDQPPSADNLENFAASLESHVDILRATIKHKATFVKLVENSDVLRIVNLPEWAGMGGVRFVPDGWETLLTDQAKTELNKLNMDLVETLKSTDNAFSLGEGADGLICVRFGMVTHETDVEELLDLVIQVGRSVQENSKVLDSMSEIVKKGIEAATQDLQRESDEKLWQEGILRHVPVVGRVVNWWSPVQKESGIKGRSLNLTQGVVESTENIYKYHMQIPGGQNQLPGNKSPPTPMVQTAVGTTATGSSSSEGHSRNVSQSSGTSVQEIQIPTSTT